MPDLSPDAEDEPGPGSAALHGGHGTRRTLLAVARHAAPNVIEATLMPSALFYVGWITVGPMAAYAAALGWAYAALLRRLHRRSRVPGILVLALIGLTARTCVAVATGSAFLYFAQPIMSTIVVAALFLASAATGRPFVARIAGDFYPLTPEIAGRHRIRRLFRHLTVLWAGVNLVNAAAGASLLLTLPTAIYVPTKTVVALSITATGVVITVIWSLRVARREGLVSAAPALEPVPSLPALAVSG